MAIWKQQLYGTGRCINCGFLGKRSPTIDEVCFHASGKDRISGIFTQHHTLEGGETQLLTIPWCFVGKANFLGELTTVGTTIVQADKVRQVIEKDRGCPSWYSWREFVSPKEHYEEFKMQQLEQERREFELKLFEMNQKLSKDSNRVMFWLTIAAIVFAVAQVVAALLALTPDSWILTQFR